jgi:hypothetical protein
MVALTDVTLGLLPIAPFILAGMWVSQEVNVERNVVPLMAGVAY